MNLEGQSKRASQACTRCRQQKMKCSGGPHPPCHRCCKIGAQCYFDQPGTSSSAISRENSTRKSNNGDKPTIIIPSIPVNYINRIQQQHSSPTSSIVGVCNTSRHEAPRSSEPANPHKRTRLTDPDMEPIQLCFSSSTQDVSLYATVQSLEVSYTSTRGYQNHAETRRSLSRANISMLDDLQKAGIPLSDAQAMFSLFGRRIASYIPPFYDTDFSTLASSSVFSLAAIYTIARYLPGSGLLRSRIGPILRNLVQNILFDCESESSPAIIKENLLGLAILYGYSEAGIRDGVEDPSSWRLDMLTVKGIIEGYAVMMRIPNMEDRGDKSPFWPLMWLWLYTMSHHCAMIHGCVPTINTTKILHRARNIVDTKIDNPHSKALVGEADLCLLWERVTATPDCSSSEVERGLDEWLQTWTSFIDGEDAAAGRQLRLHYSFTKFSLCNLLLTSNQGQSSPTTRYRLMKLNVGSDMLRSISTASPVVLDRIRYLCDFAFVMLTFVSVSILADIRVGTNPVEQGFPSKDVLAAHVHDIANLFLSLGGETYLRPAIYGRALNAACENLLPRPRQLEAESITANNAVLSGQARRHESTTTNADATTELHDRTETQIFLTPDSELPNSAYNEMIHIEKMQQLVNGSADNFIDIFNTLLDEY